MICEWGGRFTRCEEEATYAVIYGCLGFHVMTAMLCARHAVQWTSNADLDGSWKCPCQSAYTEVVWGRLDGGGSNGQRSGKPVVSFWSLLYA